MNNIYLKINSIYIVNNEAKQITKIYFYPPKNYDQNQIYETVYTNEEHIKDIHQYLINIVKENTTKESKIMFDEYWKYILLPRHNQLQINKTLNNWNQIPVIYENWTELSQIRLYLIRKENLTWSEQQYYKIKKKTQELPWSINNVYLKNKDSNVNYQQHFELAKLFNVNVGNVEFEKNLIKYNQCQKNELIYNIENLFNNFVKHDIPIQNYEFKIVNLRPYKVIVINKDKKQENIFEY